MTSFDKSQRPIVGLGVVVTSKLHPGCILLGKRKGKTGRGTYALPGGHLEYGETYEACAVRETLEETGLRLTDVRDCSVLNVIDLETNYHAIEIFVQAQVDDSHKSEPENPEPDKHEDWLWVKWDGLPPRNQLFCGLVAFIDTGYTPFKPSTS